MASTLDTTIEQHAIEFIMLYLKDGYFVSAYLKENGWYKICATKVEKDKESEQMGSGMNLEQAKELASKRSYSWAVENIITGKGIKYRKATMIKLRELAEIADRLDRNCSEKPNNCEVKNYCDDCLYTDTCDSKEFFYACTSKATISKMEQVDKDTNVRSKEPQDEPQTDYERGYQDGIRDEIDKHHVGR